MVCFTPTSLPQSCVVIRLFLVPLLDTFMVETAFLLGKTLWDPPLTSLAVRGGKNSNSTFSSRIWMGGTSTAVTGDPWKCTHRRSNPDSLPPCPCFLQTGAEESWALNPTVQQACVQHLSLRQPGLPMGLGCPPLSSNKI